MPGIEIGATGRASWSRGVVSSNAFGAALPRLRIVGLHDCRFLPISLPRAVTPHLVLARVAGFDSAVYGLPETDVHPILFEHPAKDVLVGTTALSRFVTGRYAPVDAWPEVWSWILSWLVEEGTPPQMVVVPAVKPSFTRDADLPAGSGHDAFRRGIEWFSASRLLMHPSWLKRWEHAASNKEMDGVDRGMPLGSAIGDGSEGILEGFSSRIEPDGSQPVRWHRRADCIGETSGAFGISCALDRNPRDCDIAERLNDYLYFRSEMGTGPRSDFSSASNGLLGWSLPTSPHVYYGDDNARAVLGTMVAAASTRSAKWDERILRTIVGNFRTAGKLGFRGNRLEEGPLQQKGWRQFFESESVNYAPHYESYLWALYLWAYDKTGYAPFLDRAKSAISMTMAAYPHQWRWTNGIQQERARMLLPLSWLIRVEDTPEHRRWLATITKDLLALQDASGAIREEIGSAGRGRYGPPRSNVAYGTAEAPLIQTNGDPLTDLLYTSNFAFLGLHEAAAATREATYGDATTRLADYLVRIQARSTRFPEFDGAWFRAFDFGRWDYWASNADLGWGAWSVETGWTQAWVATVLGLRELKTSVWELTDDSQVAKHAAVLIPSMLEVAPIRAATRPPLR